MLKKLVLFSALATTSAFVPTQRQRTSYTAIFSESSESEDATSSMGAEAISALTKDVKTVFSLEDIAKILPHRYPFLLVDKVVEYEEGKVSYYV